MGLSNLIKLSPFCFAMFFVNIAMSAELPKLSTKQAINNLRFISKDGKFTYFQRRSGSLLLSTNYKAIEVVKGNPGSQYTVVSSAARKKLIVSQDPYFHNFYGVRHNLRLFQLDYGGAESKEVGVGLNPQLHLNDTWTSFYDSHLKSIFFKNLGPEALSFKVVLGNTLNPYFIPETAMASDDQIFFTDINGQGLPGVILFNRKNNSMTAFYKAQTHNVKIELCSNDNYVFIASFGLNRSTRTSTILRFDKKTLAADKSETIYSSNKNDFGQLVCDFDQTSIYFIKNVSSDKKEKFEVAELNVTTKEVKTLSNLGIVSSLIHLDGLLLIPFRGEYFIVKGNADLVNDSILVNPKMPEPVLLQIPTPAPTTTPAATPAASGAAPATSTPPPVNSPTADVKQTTNTPEQKVIKPELPGLK